MIAYVRHGVETADACNQLGMPDFVKAARVLTTLGDLQGG